MTLLGTPRTASGMRAPLRDPDAVIPGGRARLEDQFALLRTPTAQLAVNGGSQHPDKRKAGGHGPTLADEVEHLLPTPTAHDSKGTGPSQARRKSPGLDAVTHLLPTPLATDGSGAMEDRREASGHGAALRDMPNLLPTPRATDGSKGGPNQRGSSGDLMLPSAVHLLPTPNDFHMGNTESPDEWLARRADVERRTGTRHGPALPVVAWSIDEGAPLVQDGAGPRRIESPDRWGPYAVAVARWEATLGRPAPSPTEPTGKDGALRLSARFVEWMMGLADGWVTDPALWEGVKPSTARNQQLKALGNGVVPQQAAAALRYLLRVRETALSEEVRHS